MSDASITIALIKLAEVLVNSVAPIITALAALAAVWLTWRNGKELKASKVEVAAVKAIAQSSGATVAAVKVIAERTSVEVKQMTTGAYAAGFLQGAADERRKSSDLGTLE